MIAARHLGLVLLLLAFPWRDGALRAAEPAPPLLLERTIPLAGVAGRIDHMAVDLKRGRLFVAELGNGTMDAIDLATGESAYRIAGLKEPQGIGYSPQADLVAVASAGDGSVRLFRAAGGAPAGRISLGDDADNVRLDAKTGHFIVGYGSGGLAVIDPASQSALTRIALPAHPEGFQLDPDDRRAFVNVPDAGQIAVVDLMARQRIAAWRVPGARANFPMALDPAGAVLATVFRDPAKLVLLDTEAGTVRVTLDTCGDADDVFFDARRHHIYVSCGAGVVEVEQQTSDGYRRLARVATRPGARTSLFVPALDRLFVAARAGPAGLPAAVLVFRPQP
jgi:DNA-binding beta-propeller fold protein YncE